MFQHILDTRGTKKSLCKLTLRTMKLEVREQKGHKLKVIPGQETISLEVVLGGDGASS